MFFLVQSVSVTHDSFDRSFFTFAPFSKQTSLLHFSFAERLSKKIQSSSSWQFGPRQLLPFIHQLVAAASLADGSLWRSFVTTESNATWPRNTSISTKSFIGWYTRPTVTWITYAYRLKKLHLIVCRYSPATFLLRGSSLTEKLRKRIRVERSPVSQPRCPW